MSILSLNYCQENELARLLDYEYATCSANGQLVYHCAFPYRPDDELQCELIERGVLARRFDEQRQSVVIITSEGYSYFPAKQQEAEERKRARQHEASMVAFSAVFGVLCVLLGFLLGHYVV